MFPSRPPLPRARFAPRLDPLESRDVPAVITIDNYYRATAGSVLDVGYSNGLLSNDFSSTSTEAVLTAVLAGPPVYADFDVDGNGTANTLANPLPANTVTVNPDGSLRVVVPSNFPRAASAIIFNYTASNALDPTETPGTARVIIYLGRPADPQVAVGVDAGQPPVVNLINTKTGAITQSIEAYEPTFTGGVRVATADFNADGTPDVATAPGEGGSARIKIFDGKTGRTLFDVILFEPTFTGGAYIAAGDVNGDGFPDLIVGAGTGGGPRVTVINGQGFVPLEPLGTEPFQVGNRIDPVTGIVIVADRLMDFYAYESSFRGGVRVAGGDIDGLKRDYVITVPGTGGGPVIKEFDFNEVVGQPTVELSGDPSNGVSTRQPLNNVGINFGGTAVPNRSFYGGRTPPGPACGSRSGTSRATAGPRSSPGRPPGRPLSACSTGKPPGCSRNSRCRTSNCQSLRFSRNTTRIFRMG